MRMINYKGRAASAVFCPVFFIIYCVFTLSKTTVYDKIFKAVSLYEKAPYFSIKTYIKNYLSKTPVFDIIMVSGTVAQRPRDRERG